MRVLLLLLVPVLAGCIQDGPAVEVHLLVTGDFGTDRVHEGTYFLPKGSTVIDLLYEATGGDLELGFGGGFVVAMFGLRSDHSGAKHDWFFEVDGVHQAVGAASVRVHDGMRVHWDMREWRTPLDIPGLFGSYAGTPRAHTPESAPWDLMPFVALDGANLTTPQGTLSAPWGLVMRSFPETSANAVAVNGGMEPPTPRLGYGVARNQTLIVEIVPW